MMVHAAKERLVVGQLRVVWEFIDPWIGVADGMPHYYPVSEKNLKCPLQFELRIAVACVQVEMRLGLMARSVDRWHVAALPQRLRKVRIYPGLAV